jgi:hypothetical protein
MLTTLHFLTHVGQSWIVLDLDGAGIVWSQHAYLATPGWWVTVCPSRWLWSRSR